MVVVVPGMVGVVLGMVGVERDMRADLMKAADLALPGLGMEWPREERAGPPVGVRVRVPELGSFRSQSVHTVG